MWQNDIIFATAAVDALRPFKNLLEKKPFNQTRSQMNLFSKKKNKKNNYRCINFKEKKKLDSSTTATLHHVAHFMEVTSQCSRSFLSLIFGKI